MTIEHTPPHVNGVVDVSESKQETLRKQIQTIVNDFVPTYDQPVCDTFYIVCTHTEKHGAQATFTQLNGDTVEHLLSGAVDVETPLEG